MDEGNQASENSEVQGANWCTSAALVHDVAHSHLLVPGAVFELFQPPLEVHLPVVCCLEFGAEMRFHCLCGLLGRPCFLFVVFELGYPAPEEVINDFQFVDSRLQ